jgi:4'-phosphopantetheinyl transferase EntD
LLNQTEQAHLDSIKVELKRLQWIASRVLIRTIINTPEFILLNKTSNGQPVLTELGHHVSISHCGHIAAVIISKSSRVGVDVEEITQRINAIRHKFIGEQEMTWLFDQSETLKTLLVWSAKETVYKWYAVGQVDFRRNIFLEKFEVSKNGMIEAIFRNDKITKPLLIHYRCYAGFILTWVID